MRSPFDPAHEHEGGRDGSRINRWLLWLGLATAVAWLFFRHNERLLPQRLRLNGTDDRHSGPCC